MTLKAKVYVYHAPLPEGIHGMTSKSISEAFIVAINSEDTPERQEQAFIHEMMHIWRDDWSKTEVSEAEAGSMRLELPPIRKA